MLSQLSDTSSYTVKDLSNSNTTVSKPGLFKRLVQRKETKNLEKELNLEGKRSEKKKSSKKSSDSLKQPYLEGPYLKAPLSRL